METYRLISNQLLMSNLNFSLTPGLGGQKNAHYGGGGGGVMVNGEGPQYSGHDGQGYGGGGAHLGTPGSGLVLLEIKHKP